MTRDLTFRWGYFGDEAYRPMLNSFAGKIFGGLDFTPWVDLGLDVSEYTPFSFFDGDRVVANVSASPMNLWVAGKQVPAVQIGTVGVAPEYRGRGLVRSLMEKAHGHWESDRQLFYLFSDEDVLEMYPRFGYRRVTEHTFQTQAPSLTDSLTGARKLDLRQMADRDLLMRLARERSPVSDLLGVFRQSWLFLFHAAVVYPDHLLYIEALGVAVISVASGHTLRLVDVIGREVPPLWELYPHIGAPGIDTVEFLFTPDRMDAGAVEVKDSTDSLLFVKGDFATGKKPFRFPATSIA